MGFAVVGLWLILGVVVASRSVTQWRERVARDHRGFTSALDQIRSAQPVEGTARWRPAPGGQVRVIPAPRREDHAGSFDLIA